MCIHRLVLIKEAVTLLSTRLVGLVWLHLNQRKRTSSNSQKPIFSLTVPCLSRWGGNYVLFWVVVQSDEFRGGPSPLPVQACGTVHDVSALYLMYLLLDNLPSIYKYLYWSAITLKPLTNWVNKKHRFVEMAHGIHKAVSLILRQLFLEHDKDPRASTCPSDSSDLSLNKPDPKDSVSWNRYYRTEVLQGTCFYPVYCLYIYTCVCLCVSV